MAKGQSKKNKVNSFICDDGRSEYGGWEISSRNDEMGLYTVKILG